MLKLNLIKIHNTLQIVLQMLLILANKKLLNHFLKSHNFISMKNILKHT